MGTVPSSESSSSHAKSSTSGAQLAGVGSDNPQPLQTQQPGGSSVPSSESPRDAGGGSVAACGSAERTPSSSGYGLASEPLHQALTHLDAATTIHALSSVSSPAYQQHLRQAAAALPPPSQLPPSPHAAGTPASPSHSHARTTTSAEASENTPEDDGYKWRKYGRKTVKGSEFPRSYYKCTHPGCTAKKQVETIVKDGGQMLHTTYKGNHNHDAPQVTRLNAEDQASFKNSVMSEFLGAATAVAADTIATMATNCSTRSPSNGTAMRVEKKAGGADEKGAHNPPQTPRLVIETRADVDHLDDGYHWRKYGQKNVKGSPHPRSYYKCTQKNCPVKKQVENNGVHIINTYEGTHNHLAPGLDESSRKRRRKRKREEYSTDSSSPSPNEERMEQEGNEGDLPPSPLQGGRPHPTPYGNTVHSKHHSPPMQLPSPSSSMFNLVSTCNSPLSFPPLPAYSSTTSSSSSSSSSSFSAPSAVSLPERDQAGSNDDLQDDNHDSQVIADERVGDDDQHSVSSTATSTSPAYPHHFSGLSPLYSVFGSPQLSISPSLSSSLPLFPSALAGTPFSPMLSSFNSPSIGSPALQSLLSSTAGLMSLSPLFDATSSPGPPSHASSEHSRQDDPRAADASNEESRAMHLDSTGHEGKRDQESADGTLQKQPEPPPFSPSPALAALLHPFAAQTSSSSSAGDASISSSMPSSLSGTPTRTPNSIPASLFVADSAVAAAMLLINEHLTQLD